MENLTDKTINDISSVETRREQGQQIQAKIEKIVTAIFMVTDYIEKNEPIRTKLRAMCLDMISSAHASNHMATIAIKNEITAIINVGKTMGLISAMNGDILLQEIKKTKDILENSFVINLEKFDLAENNLLLNSPLEEYPKGEVENSSTPSRKRSTPQEGNLTPKRHSNVVYKTTGKDINNDTRKQAILNIIKVKKSAAINDIRMSVRGVSEKTIQRDLLSLMNDGLIKKEGEKRWSKYSLR
ncbi:hypothetical protein A3A09_00445 [Candidatus Nomurabacteria bacterium RIFCSPLOWO2_01_FULL_42_20]|uniref:HTH deoR-type domain-containing protein n=1 Tax=Candidatus Nomurabacteria bacterium RIFCSPHIGHO2_01_FULL_42_16 TaxID=1801743 RepID=A0A1F6VIT2_9BACT|nr:MAG: hypothetical protein A2824_02665 [Candidatus Nomurabacteria bacterium RIFCSPHIGHO2_01_FULL_42_16]OGI91892.1 MAG: hypothetical protein A3A09_00445 [Candidatus Nomurabacteria bacterium RIFCSPLOWO2_01_FULL_42_20]